MSIKTATEPEAPVYEAQAVKEALTIERDRKHEEQIRQWEEQQQTDREIMQAAEETLAFFKSPEGKDALELLSETGAEIYIGNGVSLTGDWNFKPNGNIANAIRHAAIFDNEFKTVLKPTEFLHQLKAKLALVAKKTKEDSWDKTKSRYYRSV